MSPLVPIAIFTAGLALALFAIVATVCRYQARIIDALQGGHRQEDFGARVWSRPSHTLPRATSNTGPKRLPR